MDEQTRQNLIKEHLDAVRRLEELPTEQPGLTGWPPKGYYLLWHIVVGMVLGMVGAAVSLGFNAIGAAILDKHPLELVRVYLTFPMGADALTATDGKVLTVGCILYLVTGGLYGIGFHVLMSTLMVGASMMKRFLVGSAIGLLLWVVNFYLILSWLQPALLGGDWILTMVPWWVAALTHLAFAWTMLLVEAWGQFVPYVQR